MGIHLSTPNHVWFRCSTLKTIFISNKKPYLMNVPHNEDCFCSPTPNDIWLRCTTKRAWSTPSHIWLRCSTKKRAHISQQQAISDYGEPRRRLSLANRNTRRCLKLHNEESMYLPTPKPFLDKVPYNGRAFICQHRRCLIKVPNN